jgi:hypothetical protein
MRGVCKLCLLDGELVKSHFMPAKMYAYIRRGSRSTHDHPVVKGRRITAMTAQQVKDYVLCMDCEDLFNKNGETYTLQWMWNGEDFRLFDRLSLAQEVRTSDKYTAYSGTAIGVDTDKLAYFGLSILWRAGVHTWNTAFGEKSNRMDLGDFEEPIRRFLQGAGSFPADVAVLVTVCSDRNSQRYFYMPQRVTNIPGIVAYSFLTLGIHFMIYTMNNLAPGFLGACCASSDKRLIWMRDCGPKTLEAWVQFQGSRVVGKLAGQ